MITSIPPPPKVDEYGLSNYERREIRQTAVLAAGHVLSGTSFGTMGVHELNTKVASIAKRIESFILNGE
jgi:hypothetical protein